MGDFEQNKCVQIMSLVLRPLNFISGVGAIAVGVLVLLDWGITLRTLLNLAVTTTFGLILLAGEFNLTVINENCKFMTTFFGRGMYNVFIGGWVYSLHHYFLGRPHFISDAGEVCSFIVYMVS